MTESVVRRARHVIGEIARTVQAAQCIRERHWSEFGQLMDASHDSLRDDYEVSCKELDMAVQIGRATGTRGGVLGCRMTGGGFGGCVVALIETAKKEAIMHKIAEEYRLHIGTSASLFTSRPSDGAQIIEL